MASPRLSHPLLRLSARLQSSSSPTKAAASSAPISVSALRCNLHASPLCRPKSPESAALSPWSRSRRFHKGRARGPVADFAFAFDIDGVLVRSAKVIPQASKALAYLQSQKIPFILLTNGGGKHESDRVAELSEKLGVQIDVSMFVQSHTPYAELDEHKNKTVLVVGGDGDKCRQVAEKYGYNSVITTADILTAHPDIWPFSKALHGYYESFARPLPLPIHKTDPSKSLKVDAIFVYNDPRDWGLDAAIIIDLLLSSKGIFGTLSPKNNDPTLPNRGYQQDGQPPLYFSNPDLWWASDHHLPRLGQGGFREALEGLWAAITGGEKAGVELQKEIIGKPHFKTYQFAEKRLNAHRDALLAQQQDGQDDAGDVTPTDPHPGNLKTVYMVGDNPESDIKGGNWYKSPLGTKWNTALVRTGVYSGGEPAEKPTVIVDDVYAAVQWGVDNSGWKGDRL